MTSLTATGACWTRGAVLESMLHGGDRAGSPHTVLAAAWRPGLWRRAPERPTTPGPATGHAIKPAGHDTGSRRRGSARRTSAPRGGPSSPSAVAYAGDSATRTGRRLGRRDARADEAVRAERRGR